MRVGIEASVYLLIIAFPSFVDDVEDSVVQLCQIFLQRVWPPCIPNKMGFKGGNYGMTDNDMEEDIRGEEEEKQREGLLQRYGATTNVEYIVPM